MVGRGDLLAPSWNFIRPRFPALNRVSSAVRYRFRVMARLISLARRLTAFELAIIAWFAASVIVGAVALLIGAVFGSLLTAVLLVVGWEVIALVLGALGILRRLRFARALARTPHGVRNWPLRLAATSPAAGGPDWAAVDELRVISRIAAAFPYELLPNGMRTRSAWFREPLTYFATQGRFDFSTLKTILQSGWPAGAFLLAKSDPNLLVSLSRLTFSQNIEPGDRAMSLRILEYVLRHRGFETLEPGKQIHSAERMILAGKPELARPIVASWRDGSLTERFLTADLLNPFGISTDGGNVSAEDERAWLAAINAIYEPVGLEPIALKPAGSSSDEQTPYDRLDAAPAPPVEGGPLVSVIMTCFRPDHELVNAVNSMIAQSWQNWELLVVDDASPAEFGPVLDAVGELDPRIRVVRAAENGGTYVRRNEAIQLAAGELVTMHDSDDWAHPRRLELQVLHLLANPSLMANTSYSLRASEQLTFVQERGSVVMRLTESSLLFRKREVVDRVGYFDSVRKGADSEFRLRIGAAFGTAVPVIETAAPLAIVRFTTGSLSGSDFADGWTHPGRFAYRSAYLLWHGRVLQGKADPRLEFPLVTRPFPAPAIVLSRKPAPVPLDILVMLDARGWASGRRELEVMASELRMLAQTGLSVGVLHVESLQDGRSHDALAPVIQAMINDGIITAALLPEAVDAAVVVVRDVAILQTAPSAESAVRARRAVLIDEASNRPRYFRGRVESEAERLFGVVPEWTSIPTGLDSAIDYSFLRVSFPNVSFGEAPARERKALGARS